MPIDSIIHRNTCLANLVSSFLITWFLAKLHLVLCSFSAMPKAKSNPHPSMVLVKDCEQLFLANYCCKDGCNSIKKFKASFYHL